MQTLSELSPTEAYKKSKIRFAAIGLWLALLSSITVGIQTNFLNWGTGLVNVPVEKTATILMILSLAVLAINDFLAGIWILIWNLIKGQGLKEYIRLGKTKLGSLLLLAAFFGGPFATGALLIGVNLCGVTYSLVIASSTPILTAILGRIVFKEKINLRMVAGIIIAVAGIIALGFSPPSGDSYPYFYIGLLISACAPIGFTLEGIVATYSTDMTDPNVAVCLYRCFGSSILNLIIMIPLFGLIGGNIPAGYTLIGNALQNPTVVLILVIAALNGGVSYLSTYISFNMSGPTRTLAVVNTFGVWSIPTCVVFSAFGIIPYNITTQAIIGSFVVLFGIVLVIASPKDLLQLREV